MPTYRIQALDTTRKPFEWRDILYLWDSEFGYAWEFETGGRAGVEQEVPLEAVLSMVEELIDAREARMRVIESGTQRVVWKG